MQIKMNEWNCWSSITKSSCSSIRTELRQTGSHRLTKKQCFSSVLWKLQQTTDYWVSKIQPCLPKFEQNLHSVAKYSIGTTFSSQIISSVGYSGMSFKASSWEGRRSCRDTCPQWCNNMIPLLLYNSLCIQQWNCTTLLPSTNQLMNLFQTT